MICVINRLHLGHIIGKFGIPCFDIMKLQFGQRYRLLQTCEPLSPSFILAPRPKPRLVIFIVTSSQCFIFLFQENYTTLFFLTYIYILSCSSLILLSICFSYLSIYFPPSSQIYLFLIVQLYFSRGGLISLSILSRSSFSRLF